MDRDQLVVEARAAGQAARHNLEWLDKHPERFDQSKKEEMQSYLHMLINFSENEQKNARRLGRTRFSTPIKSLIASIIPHITRKVVVK